MRSADMLSFGEKSCCGAGFAVGNLLYSQSFVLTIFLNVIGLSQNMLLKLTDRNVCATKASIYQFCSGTGIL
ncbi:MAG: hypothetical protein EAZ92_04240, partial [Candidatus Kapaibacterium sp.]